jgi:hypothetical protein
MRRGNGVVRVLTGRLQNGSYLVEVDVNRLYFPDYQRQAIRPHVKRIAEAWDNEFARPLLVSLRDGHLNVFDGRQTSAAAAAKANPNRTLLAFVWTDWTYEREAKAFNVHNTVPKGMDGWKKYVSDMLAGNQSKQLALDLLHNMGLTTPIYPGIAQTKNADITKPNVIISVMEEGGLPLLRLFAKVLKNWKRGGVLPDTAKRTDFGRGLLAFLKSNRQNEARLLNTLKVLTPDQVRELSRTMPSKGRIDSNQIRQALEQLAGAQVRTFRRAA